MRIKGINVYNELKTVIDILFFASVWLMFLIFLKKHVSIDA